MTPLTQLGLFQWERNVITAFIEETPTTTDTRQIYTEILNDCFFYLNLFRNSDVLDGDQKYKKVLNSDSGIWHLSSVGDEFYLPGEAALHTQLRRSGLSDFFSAEKIIGGLLSFTKRWQMEKTCSCSCHIKGVFMSKESFIKGQEETKVQRMLSNTLCELVEIISSNKNTG